jgi:P pilus assembly chaperone PapD
MKKIISAFLVMLSVTTVRGQVVVAPTVLFLSDQSPFGTFLVMNRSDTPQEITISFRFGFPQYDSLGGLSMQYNDSSMAREHSCQDWLRGFPQRFIINPGQEQVVRLLAAGPPNIPDGEYWTRLITSSTPQAKPVDSTGTGIRTNITFILQQVTTVIYKKGYANTTANIEQVQELPDSAAIGLLARVSHGGNSPFFGRISIDVKNGAGKTVYSDQEVLAIYQREAFIKFSVPRSGLSAGSYSAEIKLDSQRSDVPSEDLLAVPTVTKTVAFSIR